MLAPGLCLLASGGSGDGDRGLIGYGVPSREGARERIQALRWRWLYLLVKPNGARLWNQAYRFAGKHKKLSHGPHPIVALSEARRLRDDAKRSLASGVDPGANKKAEKVAAGSIREHLRRRRRRADREKHQGRSGRRHPAEG
ncbi:Arm DNA-binding domain-containing protein [Ancylobacter sp. Lp-2]|uniref:Arm DNA-binding domain-containing protein n=1 Tax=Ancylobacter sp. Lp-2 TaxID=2881339 RepID=UPI001E39D293|nr:Arm DNA-binding domain-containing protein [Ancylobacter sp. Lp-2]MCB4770090.1 Arm DNA-binding domain-containing protein [Ancylobacter sp. Lp-2]